MRPDSSTSAARADRAQTVALRALADLLNDDDHLMAFLAFSGADGSSLAAEAANPVFLGAVLDFILQEDQRVLRVADLCEIDPAEIAALRQALPG